MVHDTCMHNKNLKLPIAYDVNNNTTVKKKKSQSQRRETRPNLYST